MVEISVIIPVYNAANFLPRCLDSLLAQQFANWQAVLIDDGSIDESWQIMQKYAKKDRRFKIIRQENTGQSIAKNRALMQAEGRYISFIDADDWVSDDFLQKLYERIEQENADVAFASIVKVKNDKKKDKLRIIGKDIFVKPWDIYKAFGMPENCFIWNKLYKKSSLSFKFVEGMYFEDIVFSHEVVWGIKKAVSVEGAEYYYFANPTSTVNTISEKKKDDYGRALQISCDIMKKNGAKFVMESYVPIIKKKICGGLLTMKDWGIKKVFYFLGIFKVWAK